MAENRTRCGWANFTVVGHTDRSGPDAYNDGLALRRAHAIADMMGGAGLPAGTIAVSGMGERQPRLQTVEGQRTLENRRVEGEVHRSKDSRVGKEGGSTWRARGTPHN